MKFARIDALMGSCKAHLDASGARNTDIESFLVGFALVSIASDYDAKLKEIVGLRVARSQDLHIQSYARAAVGKLVRSIGIGEIAGMLGQFSPDCKTAFHNTIKDQSPHVAYDNIITNRHAIAHATGSNMTFQELEDALIESAKVFDAVCDSLGLTQDEIDSLG